MRSELMNSSSLCTFLSSSLKSACLPLKEYDAATPAFRKSPEAGMSRISRNALATTVRKVRAMNFAQQERLADELFQAQPLPLPTRPGAFRSKRKR